MGGGKILEMIKRVYKDDPDAISAINETLSKNKKATDDSNVDKEKIKKLQPKSMPKRTARDDSEKNWLIDIYVDGKYSGKFYYFGKLNSDLLINYIRKNIWTKKISSALGSLDNFNIKIDEMGS